MSRLRPLPHSVFLVSLAILVGCGSGRKTSNSDPVPTDSSIAHPNSPSSPSLPPNDTGGIVSEQQFMIFHNLKRCWHNVSSVKWSAKLADEARGHASTCNAEVQREGESVTLAKDLDIIKALDQWYLEGMIWFPYGKDEIPPDMRRFAQMVWKETTEIGCAENQCGDEKIFVCRYNVGIDKTKAATNVYGLKPDFLTCTGM